MKCSKEWKKMNEEEKKKYQEKTEKMKKEA